MSTDEHTNVHSMCDECWTLIVGDREPKRILGGIDQECCWCGGTHRSDIWIREGRDDVPIHNNPMPLVSHEAS